jgi:hypothetical protein
MLLFPLVWALCRVALGVVAVNCWACGGMAKPGMATGTSNIVLGLAALVACGGLNCWTVVGFGGFKAREEAAVVVVIARFGWCEQWQELDALEATTVAELTIGGGGRLVVLTNLDVAWLSVVYGAIDPLIVVVAFGAFGAQTAQGSNPITRRPPW